ncbi:hypothetical protein D3C76_1223470 [compost metagenome]
MGNLAVLSKQLNGKSTAASISNLKLHINLHKKNKHLVTSYLSYPRSQATAIDESGNPVLIDYPRRQGIGAAAFKKLNSSVVGGKSLTKHIERVGRDEGNKVGWLGDYRTTMEMRHVRVADELLRSLSQ